MILNNLDLILIIVLGMISGSFITMASFRLAIEGEKVKDLLFTPSSCIKCGHKLGVKNLIPIFSWLFQAGKCSFCKAQISIRYPVIELICAISFVIIYFSLGKILDLKLAITIFIFLALFTMIITDLEHYFISDLNQIILLVLIIIYHIFVTLEFNINKGGNFWHYLYSAFAFLAFGLLLHFIFKYFTGQEGIGKDDIKFFALAGLMIGTQKFALFMFLSGIMGIIFGIIWQKVKKDSTFPFAPSLVASLIISILVDLEKLDFFLL